MPRYRVRRTFPTHHPVRVGQLLEDPNYRNLQQLVSQGYLEEVPGRMLGAGKPVEEIIESPVADAAAKLPAEVTEPALATPKSKSSRKEK